MKNIFLLGVTLLSLSFNANAYIWTSAAPTEVHIVPEGLMLVGDFNNAGVSCATDAGKKSIFLPKTDAQFQAKLSLALTAQASGKKIEVLINDPIETNCTIISAQGAVPNAFYYYWRLKN